MKRNFWLILAVLSLLGLILMPSMAHSAPILEVPANLAQLTTVNAPRVTLNSSIPTLNIARPRMALPTIKFLTDSPMMVPTADVRPVLAAPQSAIPADRIEGISAPQQERRAVRVSATLSRISALSNPEGLVALFDGSEKSASAKAEPVVLGEKRVAPVQAAPAQKHVETYEDTSLTLPESDLLNEIGAVGY